MEKSFFILRTENKTFFRKEGESPRGLRDENHRPNLITVQVEKTVDRNGLSRLIKYLIELENAMEL